MTFSSDSIDKVVEMFSALPTIGRKTAQRLAFYMLRQPEQFSKDFSDALILMKKNIHFCSVCNNYTEKDPCPVCSSEKRKKGIICVVEEPNDVMAIEKTGEYSGMYHVLHGTLNPLEGISPNDLKIKELMERLHSAEEIILAINPSVEGEVTMQYIAKMIKPLGIKVTRLARGLPIGSDLEYADEATISKALEGRISFE